MDLNTAETFDFVFLPEGTLTAENEFLTDTAGGSESDVTFNLGALVNPDGDYRAGFVFKRGPEFRAVTSTSFSCSGPLGSLCGPPSSTSFAFDFNTPSIFGGGFSARPVPGLVLGVDIVRITYSDLDIPEFDEFQDPIDDATEVHLGGEYTFLSLSSPLTVRAGFYNDPDHDGLDAVDSSDNHFTFGGGVVIAERMQIDGAANLADQVKEFLFSVVVEIR
jgi:hypothetical protein